MGTPPLALEQMTTLSFAVWRKGTTGWGIRQPVTEIGRGAQRPAGGADNAVTRQGAGGRPHVGQDTFGRARRRSNHVCARAVGARRDDRLLFVARGERPDTTAGGDAGTGAPAEVAATVCPRSPAVAAGAAEDRGGTAGLA